MFTFLNLRSQDRTWSSKKKNVSSI